MSLWSLGFWTLMFKLNKRTHVEARNKAVTQHDGLWSFPRRMRVEFIRRRRVVSFRRRR